jgi:hypothetical protein
MYSPSILKKIGFDEVTFLFGLDSSYLIERKKAHDIEVKQHKRCNDALIVKLSNCVKFPIQKT